MERTMSVFQYSATEELIFERMASENGYERKTTFFADLSIAEYVGGKSGVMDTFNRVVKEWKTDKVYFTEFVLCLNWKCWEHYEKDDSLSELYSDLYYNARDIVYAEWKDKKDYLSYFFEVTD